MTTTSEPALVKTSEAAILTTGSYWSFRRLVNTGVLPQPIPESYRHAPLWERDGLLKAWNTYRAAKQ